MGRGRWRGRGLDGPLGQWRLPFCSGLEVGEGGGHDL